MQITLAELAEQCGASVQGDGALLVDGVCNLVDAESGKLSIYTDRCYRQAAVSSAATAILTRPDLATELKGPLLIAENPLLVLAHIMRLFEASKGSDGVLAGVDASASISSTAMIAEGVAIAAGVFIGARVQLAAGVSIGPGSVLYDDVSIGKATKIDANVTIYHACHLGQDCRISAGVVIGADGFGFAEDTVRGVRRWVAIPQAGRVWIGDAVHVGANSAIDRGSLEDTVIGDGVIIDNLVQIAHNVRIGRHTAIAGCAAIAGSARIGENCKLGGRSSIIGHLSICDDVVVFADSLVTRSIDQAGVYSSAMPAMPVARWRKLLARFRRSGRSKRAD